MNKFNRKIISIVLVILTILAMFMLEKFTDENKSDKVYQKIDLTQNYITDCTIDINNMGIVKYYIEPNIVSVYLRIKVDKNARNLSYTTEKLDVIVSQGTKKGIWPKLNPEDELEKNKKNIIPLRIKPHTPLLVRAPVNSFEFQPCGRTPQVGYLLRLRRHREFIIPYT